MISCARLFPGIKSPLHDTRLLIYVLWTRADRDNDDRVEQKQKPKKNIFTLFHLSWWIWNVKGELNIAKMSYMCWHWAFAALVQWHFHCISARSADLCVGSSLFCISRLSSLGHFIQFQKSSRNAFHSLSIASVSVFLSTQFLELLIKPSSDSLTHAFVVEFDMYIYMRVRERASKNSEHTAAVHSRSEMRLLHSSMGHISHDFSNNWSPRATLLSFFLLACLVCCFPFKERTRILLAQSKVAAASTHLVRGPVPFFLLLESSEIQLQLDLLSRQERHKERGE